jgi:endoglucanase Acf2
MKIYLKNQNIIKEMVTINKRKLLSGFLAAALLTSVLPAFRTEAVPATVNVGLGGYSLEPMGSQPFDWAQDSRANRLPPSAANIYKTSNLTGAIPSNDWASSVLFDKYSEALYAHPMSFQATSEGLEISNPPKEVAVSLDGEADVTRVHRAGNIDLVVKPSTFSPLDARVDKATDWTYDIMMANGSNSMKATIGHGVPYAFFKFTGANPEVLLKRGTSMEVVSGTSSSQYISIRIKDNKENKYNYYGLFAPAGTTWNITSTKISANLPSGKGYFTVALLPDERVETLNFYKEYAYNFITDTKVAWNYNEQTSKVTTTFNVTTQNMAESTKTGTIFALYPHQWRNNSLIAPLSYTYASIRGLMKTVAGTSFSTELTYQGVLPSLPELKDTTASANLKKYLTDYYGYGVNLNPPFVQVGADAGNTGYDTYWMGKNIERTANLMTISDQLDNTDPNITEITNKMLEELKKTLQWWFTPVKYNEQNQLVQDNFFYYNSDWGTLIGYPQSYNTAKELNDHYFHYGYWIYAAAQIALRDPEWAKNENWGGMVNELIADIANSDRTNTKYPFLRNFDPYAGHSWASGHADYDAGMMPGGNNQESSSEAINAWTALIIWGEATNNKQIRDLGVYLYTTEVEAINNYYFDIYGDILAPEYKAVNETVCQLWGGRYNHTTWWTEDPIQTKAINILPITGGSYYLGRNPQVVKANYDDIWERWPIYLDKTAQFGWNGNKNPDMWQDILCQYYALYDPATALNKWKDLNAGQLPAEKAVDPGIGIEFGESRAKTYQFMKGLDTYGLPDFSVRGSYVFSYVFNKNGVKTYVVYNPTSAAKAVTFSNGISVTAAAKSMYVGQGQALTDAQAVDADKTALAVGFASGDSDTSVKSNVTLPTSGANGTTITWASSNGTVVSTAGVVVRQTANTTVTLTATIKKGTATATKTFTVTVIAAENTMTDAQAVTADSNALAVGYASGDTAAGVRSNVTLSTAGTNGTTITWASSNTAVISTTGVVTRPAANTNVTLTATIRKGTASTTKAFTLTVLAAQMTDAQAVTADSNALAVGYASGDTAAGVRSNVTLSTAGTNGTTITWASSNTAVISTAGVVTRPAANTNVTLTATIRKGTASTTKAFTLTVLAAQMTDAQAVTADSNALALGYVSGDSATSVKGNVTLPTSGANGTTITWASSNTAVISTAGVVTRQIANTTVTLTATIRKGTASTTKNFTLTVIAKETSSDVIDTAHFTVTLQKLSDTSAKLVLAPKGTIDWVDIHFIVNNGGQQNVRMLKVGSNWEQTITNLNNGDTIKFNFTYFTTYGQDSAWFTSVFSTTGTNPVDPNVTAVEADKAALAVGYASGDSATSVKSNVTLPTTGANGSTITWVSNTTTVVSNTGVVTRPSYTTGNKTVTLTATLTKGTATTTKSFTVTVIALSMTDTEAVTADKNTLNIGYASGESATSIKSNVTLPTTGANGTTITWASSNTSVVSIIGVVTRPSANTNVTLTATIKKGTASSTKSFTVTVIAAETGFVTNDFNVSFTKTSTTSAKIVVTPKVSIGWVDIHYIVNTGGQQNVRMTNVNGIWEVTISNLKAGDTVKYNFTYFTTAGYDSIWFTSGF